MWRWPRRFELGGGDAGLGDVVEDAGLVGVAVADARGFGELRGEDEDVVGETVGLGGELPDAAVEGCIVEEAGGFGLDDVAEAAEFGVGAEGIEEGGEVGVGERNPADHGGDFGCGGG